MLIRETAAKWHTLNLFCACVSVCSSVLVFIRVGIWKPADDISVVYVLTAQCSLTHIWRTSTRIFINNNNIQTHTDTSHVSRIIYTFEKLNKYWCRHFKLQRKQQQQDGKKENNCRLINEKALMWLCMIFQFVAIVAQFVPLTSSTHGAQWRKSVWVNVNVSECAFVFLLVFWSSSISMCHFLLLASEFFSFVLLLCSFN